MESILVSACLLGDNTKYDGRNNYISLIEELKTKYNIIPICPEVMGGLKIPRDPSEIIKDKVISSKGIDVSYEYNKGANLALDLAIKNKCRIAILKESSPSCGVNKIYDGTFTHTKINGMGITAKLLKENGIKLYTENDIKKLLNA